MLNDFGAGEYVKDYFSEKRYEFLVTRSLGHSVPYINKKEQMAGEEYCGKLIKADGNECIMEIAGAYPDDTLKSLRRSFRCEKDGMVLRDEFEFSQQPSEVCERFVTLTEPKVDKLKGRINLNGHSVLFEPLMFDIHITSEVYSNHEGLPTTAYLIDAIAKKNIQVMTCEFKFI